MNMIMARNIGFITQTTSAKITKNISAILAGDLLIMTCTLRFYAYLANVAGICKEWAVAHSILEQQAKSMDIIGLIEQRECVLIFFRENQSLLYCSMITQVSLAKLLFLRFQKRCKIFSMNWIYWVFQLFIGLTNPLRKIMTS